MSAELPKIVNGHIISKALTYQNYSTPYSLTPLELPTASQTVITKPNQVLIKNLAVAFNPVDALLKEFVPKLPLLSLSSSTKVAGCDFAGVVLEIGSEVKDVDFKVGDKVSGCLLHPLTQNNAFQEYILLDIKQFFAISKIPEGLSLEEAAGLGVVSATSFTAFSSASKIVKGGNVLVLAAGSSTGILGVQLAKYFGAKFIAATSSPRAAEMAKTLGADAIVDYTKGAKSEINDILELVKVHGKFDFIYDPIRDVTLINSLDHILKSKKEGGKISIVNGSFGHGRVSGYSEMIPPFKFFRLLVSHAIGLSNIDVHIFQMTKTKGYSDVITELGKQGTLKVPIDSVHNFYTEYAGAYEKIVSGKAKGKVILTLE